MQGTPGYTGSAVVQCVFYSDLSVNEQTHKLEVANDLLVLEVKGD
jgi:hypothetical protein